MSASNKPVRGLVVDHKTAGVRYAVSLKNFNPKIHTKVRELNHSETVRGFRPKKITQNKPTPAQANQTPSRKD